MSESIPQPKGGWGRAALFVTLGIALSMAIFASGVMTGILLDSRLLRGANLQPPTLPDIAALESSGQPQTAEEEVDMTTFWEVWNTLEDRFYYELPSPQERVYGAIEGLINSLDDPYTSFVSPEVARILEEDSSGTFEGIGAFVEEAPEGGVYIIRVFEDGPAAKAGIRAGDIIIAADGVDLVEKSLQEALLLIRGPAGTSVTLTIVRKGVPEPFEVSVTRARLDIPTVETRMLEDHIGYVLLYDFNARSSERLRTAVRQLMDQGAEKLILDLRGNPGGFLDEAVSIADLFLPQGTVLIQRDVDGRTREYSSRNGDFAERISLVVLINEGSASASEIVAAAIQDNRRGTLIGQTSFGKGAVQLQYTLSDGSLLRVTYAAWFTPNDETINGRGVTPDIVVEAPEELTEADLQLERAVKFLQSGH